MKKRILSVLVLAALSAPQVMAGTVTAESLLNNAQSGEEHQQRGQHKHVQTFTLNLWAPDEVPPAEAKLAEVGDSYHYLFTVDRPNFLVEDTDRVVKVRFHDDTQNRYQFRWITAEYPEGMTLTKKTHKKINIALDDGELAESNYFEVWVYDTQTGQRFMCDPAIIIIRPPN